MKPHTWTGLAISTPGGVKLVQKNRSSGKRDWPSALLQGHFLPVAVDTSQLAGQQKQETWGGVVLLSGVNVFRLPKAITQEIPIVVWEVPFNCLSHLGHDMNPWWFLLSVLFCGLAVNLKGTQCVLWVSLCHGCVCYQWASQSLNGEAGNYSDFLEVERA